ncbi:hypothetical protein QBC36DRAFT_391307 [Triangularia setosa]|uniref:Uncharacterized protein n=1 Tax=Triangularia setosa TaxID=2587417 RepID=A0AAN6VZU8_9PEZI|nr:hypothetical protein QBC36DRAFT_391307 [Podospora setosa]
MRVAESVPSMAYRVGVPGLNKALNEEDLEKSRNIYNDSQQPEICKSHIHDLATLFVQNRAHSVFGIHLVHAHFTVTDKTVLLGVDHETPRCRWAKATAFQAIDLSNVHGHIFVLTDHGFPPYQYQTGPVPDLSHVEGAFFAELAHPSTDLRGWLPSLLGFVDQLENFIHELYLSELPIELPSSNSSIGTR